MSATTFTIVTALDNPDREAFTACIESVLAQTYQDWRWCIAISDSHTDWERQLVEELASSDQRVTIVATHGADGLAQAINTAFRAAHSDFVISLDQSDRLDAEALGVVNHEICLNESIDLLYGDEGTINDLGECVPGPRRPAWAPERLLCEDYCGRSAALRRELVEAVDGWRGEFGGATHYDLLLRVAERTQQVGHVARPLSYRAPDLQADAAPARRRAAAAALERRGIAGEVVDIGHGIHRVNRRATATPLVSIIVPTRGTRASVWGLDVSLVVNMLDSVVQMSTYPDIEFVVVYDAATPDDVLDDIQRVCPDAVLVRYDEKFNFSKTCNLGALAASGDILVLMNDDMEVRTPGWIEAMVAFLEDPEVGIVGPMLLYDSFLVQSAGHADCPPNNFGRGQSPVIMSPDDSMFAINREVMGVTGACMALRREVFFGVGGLSTLFPLNFNDVDLCYKVIDAGHRIVWTPTAEIFHFESKSRETLVSHEEMTLLYRLWGRYLQDDPLTPVENDA